MILLKKEYNRLNDYKDTLEEGDQVKVQVNLNGPDKNISSGIIDDD